MTTAVRYMYDSTSPADIPLRPQPPRPPVQLVSSYINGAYANSTAMKHRFPQLPQVTITVTGDAHAVAAVIDRETHDATAKEAASWAKARHRAGHYPVIYCNRSSWPDVIEAVRSVGLDPTHAVGWWIADWTGKPHRLKAQGCTALAVQYADPRTSGGHYDLSVVYDYWPGVDPVPARPLNARHRRWVRRLGTVWGLRAHGVPAKDAQLLIELRHAIDRVLELD